MQVSKWKKELQERLPELFKNGPDKEKDLLFKEKECLERKVGALTMDIDFLKKKCLELRIPLNDLK
jgi:hypothetical protein